MQVLRCLWVETCPLCGARLQWAAGAAGVLDCRCQRHELAHLGRGGANMVSGGAVAGRRRRAGGLQVAARAPITALGSGVGWRAGFRGDAGPLGICWRSGTWAASELMSPDLCLFSFTGCSQVCPLLVSLGLGCNFQTGEVTPQTCPACLPGREHLIHHPLPLPFQPETSPPFPHPEKETLPSPAPHRSLQGEFLTRGPSKA